MKLVRIFSPSNNPGEGLFAVEYEKGEQNSFEAFLESCRDPEYAYKFCKAHILDLHHYFKRLISPYDAADQILNEADALERWLLRTAMDPNKWGDLQTVFKPLNNRAYELTFLQECKASLQRQNPILRVYAVRVSPRIYIVTGGAFKLTETMGERQHTIDELNKIKKVCAWLKEIDVLEPDEIVNLL